MKSSIAKRCALIGVATLAAGLSMNQASAAESEAPQVVVRYSDLNLSQAQDARVLYGRIQRAAREVCSNVGPEASWLALRFHTCYERAVTNAVAAVSSPRVEEIHEARSKFLSRG